MLRRLYLQTMKLAASPKAPAWLAAVSFAESSFFPVPPDVMLAPMVLARRDKAYVYAAICTAASVMGGMLGYAIGYFLEPAGMWLLTRLGSPDTFAQSKALFQEHGAWVILIKGATPIPYKLITISAGLFAYSFPLFIVLSVLTRGVRFFLVAFVLERFGPAMLPTIEKRLYLITAIVVGLFLAGFLLVRLFH